MVTNVKAKIHQMGRWERVFQSSYQKADLFWEANNARRTCRSQLAFLKGGYCGDKYLFRSQVLPFWRKYGIKPDKMWYDLYCYKDGTYDPCYIPEDLYWERIYPACNSPGFRHAYTDKCFYHKLFPYLKQPRTILRNSNHCFFDGSGKIIRFREAVNLLQSENSFVIKPAIHSGEGINIFFYEHDQYPDLDFQKLLQAYYSDYIVQEVAAQHKVLAAIHPKSLNTIRVISFLFQGDVHISSSILRMGTAGSRLDNFSAGGIACPILPDGRLGGKAITKRSQWLTSHPNGTVLSRIQIPSYQRILAAIRRAHKDIPHFRIIGWDFSIDEAGDPVLIEYNGAPGMNQISCGPLFGDLTEPVLNTIFLHADEFTEYLNCRAILNKYKTRKDGTMNISVLGAGNCGTSVAADLSRRGHEVTLIKTSHAMHDQNFNTLLENGGVVKICEKGKTTTTKISHVTRDLSRISESDLILILIQTNYHEDLIRHIKPYLHDGQILLINPGYLSTAYVLKHCPNIDLTICEAQSAFIDCRISEPGRIKVGFRNVRNPIGIYPAKHARKAKDALDTLGFPFVYLPSVLEAALHNPNLIVHTVGAVMSIPRIEKTNGEYCMYHEVFTPGVWRILESLDGEKMDVMERLGCERLSYVEACKYRNTLDDTRDAKEVFFWYAAMPTRAKGPVTVDSRYISEDVPQGLVLLETLGEKFRIGTPICSSLINMASAALGRDLRLEGRTLDRLGEDIVKRIIRDKKGGSRLRLPEQAPYGTASESTL